MVSSQSRPIGNLQRDYRHFHCIILVILVVVLCPLELARTLHHYGQFLEQSD
jgi:hypothetical protein